MRSVFFLVFFLTLSSSYAWDTIGHYVVGELASKHISKKTATKMDRLLKGDSIAHAGIWADMIKSDDRYNHISPWHYVNIPREKEYIASLKSFDGDIIRAIILCEDLLRGKKASFERKSAALKLLIHFVADIHQPLHNGYGADRGGNNIVVTWFDQVTNLHMVWDKHMIELQKMSYTEYAKHINRFSPGQLKKIQDSFILDWHQESNALVDQIYNKLSGHNWEYKYNYLNIKILNDRLKKAGIRLAYMLEQIFSNRPQSKKMLKLKKIISSEKLLPLKNI